MRKDVGLTDCPKGTAQVCAVRRDAVTLHNARDGTHRCRVNCTDFDLLPLVPMEACIIAGFPMYPRDTQSPLARQLQV